MKFVIPLRREDLLRPSDEEDEYWVRSVLSVRELLIKLKDCDLAVRRSGCDFVLDGGFDALYSVLAHARTDISPECLETAFGILVNSLADLESKLDHLLIHEIQTTSAPEKERWLNMTKMLVYLLCQLMEVLESKDTSNSQSKLVVRGGGRRGAKKSSCIAPDVWTFTTELKLTAVTKLYQLANHNLTLLFDPPVVEEDFVNTIANSLFRLLENQSMGLQRWRDLRLSIFQLLGVLNYRYGYGLSCRLKTVQSLRHFEHLAQPLAEAVDLFTKEYSCHSMIIEIVRDLAKIPAADLQRDTSGTRAFATFLTELAERQPTRMKSCLSLLMVHLDEENYSMRKCVLAVFGEIVLREFNGIHEALDSAAKDTRDQLLDCLEDHVHDAHAHVRSSVLQVWGKLCLLQKTIPLNRQHRLLRLVIGRLQDKSSNVRKQAVQLLTTLLQCNPFSAKISVEELKQELEKEKETLRQLQPQPEAEASDKLKEWEVIEKEVQEDIADKESGSDEDVTADNNEEQVWENATANEVVHRLLHLMEKKKYARALALLRSARKAFPDTQLFGAEDVDSISALKAVFLAANAALEEANANEEANSELQKQQVLVDYLTDSVAFAESMNYALPTICTLLRSKQSSDILEAINFFVSAFEFGFVKAMLGIRQMLTLVWTREQVVKEAVVNAYKKLYIDSDENESVKAASIARNFIALVSTATIGELDSLEELVCMLVNSGDIEKPCFKVLWQHFTKPGTADESRCALVLLGMIASAQPIVITSNMDLIIRTALVERGRTDFRLAHDACAALVKVAIANRGGSNSPNAPLKFPRDHELFKGVTDLVVEGITDRGSNFYVPMSQNAMSVVYQFSENPDVLCGTMLKQICEQLLKNKEEQGDTKLDTMLVTRLVSLVGNLAICQLNHLDVNILTELKRRQMLREKKKENTMNRRRSSMAKRRSRQQQGGEDMEDMECIGAEADDAEVEYIRDVCENELVGGTGNLLDTFAPLVLHLCKNPSRYKDPKMRIAASLSLAKLMLLSSKFCEEHLQLLFTLMEKSEEPVLRANLIVACGDLSSRFPNVLEPWTPNMYGRLRDTSQLVRSNTLTVLTHLILNDMIKVKGQISDIALCVADDNEKIAGLSKNFFSELARKGNSLYNVMPDIISRLSSLNSGVAEEKFRSIMDYIVALIEKDKHLESLVEKLCHRFQATSSHRQWRDLSYCLSLFPSFSEKAIKKLIENFSCFSDKLHDDAVHAAFSGIIVQARKNIKIEARAGTVDELDDMMAKAREKCLDDHKATTRAERAAKKAVVVDEEGDEPA